MHENCRQKSYIQQSYKKKQFLLTVTFAASGASRQFPVVAYIYGTAFCASSVKEHSKSKNCMQ